MEKVARLIWKGAFPAWVWTLEKNECVENLERVSAAVTRIEAELAQYRELCTQMEELRDSERQIQEAMLRLEGRVRKSTILRGVGGRPQQGSRTMAESRLRPQKDMCSCSGSEQYRRCTRTMAESHVRPHEDMMSNCSRPKEYRRCTRAMMADSHLRPMRTQAVEENVDAQRASMDEEESVDERVDPQREMDHEEESWLLDRTCPRDLTPQFLRSRLQSTYCAKGFIFSLFYAIRYRA
jgi:hypothetical protein